MKALVKHTIYAGILLIIVFSILACPKPEDDKSVVDIVGTWYMTSGQTHTELTTNSDQTAVIPYAEAIGSIFVSGDVTTTLSYVRQIAPDDSTLLIGVSNGGLFGLLNYPTYRILAIINTNSGTINTMFIAEESMDSVAVYYGDFLGGSIDISYDLSTHTLNIQPLELLLNGSDSSSVVNISGTVQAKTANIPANTPTEVEESENVYDLMSQFVLNFESDATWSSIVTIEYENEADADTGSGIWEIVNDRLMIYSEYESLDTSYVDTVAMNYSLSGGGLTLSWELDFCDDDYIPYDECMSDREEYFSLESGSLSNIVGIAEVNFSQTAPVAKITEPYVYQLGELKNPANGWAWHQPLNLQRNLQTNMSMHSVLKTEQELMNKR